MKKTIVLSSALVAMVVMTGCLGSTAKPTANHTNSTSTKAENKTYKIGEEAPAGDIVHKVVSAETMDVIPASATLPDWESIAEDLPAADGFTWVHVIGKVTNNSKESQSVDSTNIAVVDDQDNKYSVSTDTNIYVESDKSPIYIDVQPTQTIDWEGYFQVSKAAKGLALYGNDLSFLPDAEVKVDLGL